MKKKIALICAFLMSVLLAFAFVGCDDFVETDKNCKHEWMDATCTAPVTCKLCGSTVGQPKGHSGGEATCDKKAVCEVCNTEYGEVDQTKHKGGEATCVKKAVCEVCNTEYGEVDQTKHKGGEATCDKKAVCEVCNTEYGKFDKSKHASDEFTRASNGDGTHNVLHVCCNELVKSEPCSGGTAVCDKKAVCDVCGSEYGDYQHVFSDLIEEVAATCHTLGVKAHKTCYMCNKNFDEKGAEMLDLTITINPDAHTSTETKLVANNDGTHNEVYVCCNGIKAAKVACVATNVDDDCTTAEICVCGYVTKAAAEKHNFVDNKCSVCGKEDYSSKQVTEAQWKDSVAAIINANNYRLDRNVRLEQSGVVGTESRDKLLRSGDKYSFDEYLKDPSATTTKFFYLMRKGDNFVAYEKDATGKLVVSASDYALIQVPSVETCYLNMIAEMSGNFAKATFDANIGAYMLEFDKYTVATVNGEKVEHLNLTYALFFNEGVLQAAAMTYKFDVATPNGAVQEQKFEVALTFGGAKVEFEVPVNTANVVTEAQWKAEIEAVTSVTNYQIDRENIIESTDPRDGDVHVVDNLYRDGKQYKFINSQELSTLEQPEIYYLIKHSATSTTLYYLDGNGKIVNGKGYELEQYPYYISMIENTYLSMLVEMKDNFSKAVFNEVTCFYEIKLDTYTMMGTETKNVEFTYKFEGGNLVAATMYYEAEVNVYTQKEKDVYTFGSTKVDFVPPVNDGPTVTAEAWKSALSDATKYVNYSIHRKHEFKDDNMDEREYEVLERATDNYYLEEDKIRYSYNGNEGDNWSHYDLHARHYLIGKTLYVNNNEGEFILETDAEAIKNYPTTMSALGNKYLSVFDLIKDNFSKATYNATEYYYTLNFDKLTLFGQDATSVIFTCHFAYGTLVEATLHYEVGPYAARKYEDVQYTFGRVSVHPYWL